MRKDEFFTGTLAVQASNDKHHPFMLKYFMPAFCPLVLIFSPACFITKAFIVVPAGTGNFALISLPLRPLSLPAVMKSAMAVAYSLRSSADRRPRLPFAGAFLLTFPLGPAGVPSKSASWPRRISIAWSMG